MARVDTARGPVDEAELGAVLMHEHLFLLSSPAGRARPESIPDEGRRVGDAVDRLGRLKERGIDALVDLTVEGAGRYLPRIQAVAARVDLHIIAAAGLFVLDRLPPPLEAHPDPTRILVETFIGEIREGIGGTGVKAAVLKCATGRRGVTPGVERVLRATARAQLATGVPICTHTHAASRNGLDQLRIFAEEGVDPARVVIGHSGDTTDLGYLERLMETGACIGMDRFGIDPILCFERRVDTLARLCRMGYAAKMVLSHDASCYNDAFPEARAAEVPNWHYLHLPDDVIPALRARGIGEGQIRTMLVDNPRAILAGGSRRRERHDPELSCSQEEER